MQVDAYPNIKFAGNSVNISASVEGYTSAYSLSYGDGKYTNGSVFNGSTSHLYTTVGSKTVTLRVYDSSGIGYTSTDTIYINPTPAIEVSGNPVAGTTLTIKDGSGPFYSQVSYVKFNMGDGTPTFSATPTSAISKLFSVAGAYTIGLSAYDVSGAVATDSYILRVFSSQPQDDNSFEITACGPDIIRFDGVRKIDLVTFLPDYLKLTEDADFIQFFEDFLNTLYDGVYGFNTTETEISTDVSSLTHTFPDESSTVDQKISILEKIHRLSDLHDPSVIDDAYIQFFARFMGYNIDITRPDIGGFFGTFGDDNQVFSASENAKYLRFMVESLPSWYRIKATNDMIRIMLYSFGLVGDIITFYSNDYDKNWKLDYGGQLQRIPSTWYPTPHFGVIVNTDTSTNNIMFDVQQGNRIINAIQGVKPMQMVFRGLIALTTVGPLKVYVGANYKVSNYVKVIDDGNGADWWAGVDAI